MQIGNKLRPLKYWFERDSHRIITSCEFNLRPLFMKYSVCCMEERDWSVLHALISCWWRNLSIRFSGGVFFITLLGDTNDMPNYMNYSVLAVHSKYKACAKMLVWAFKIFFTWRDWEWVSLNFVFDSLYARCIKQREADKKVIYGVLADFDKCNFYRTDKGEFSSSSPQTPFYDPLSPFDAFSYKQLLSLDEP